MMNRCITCGKIVTRPKAQNSVKRDGHEYLVCCPLCEKEFHRDPAHYTAVARSLFGDYAVKAHSQTQVAERSIDTDITSRSATELVHIVRNLKESFETLERDNTELSKHLDQISASGGLEGLRKALSDHRRMMDAIEKKMAVHAGVCRFVLSVTESSVEPMKATSD